MSSTGIDTLQGYSLGVLVGLMARNLLNVLNRVGDGASAPNFGREL